MMDNGVMIFIIGNMKKSEDNYAWLVEEMLDEI